MVRRHPSITVLLLWLAPLCFLLLFYFYPMASILKLSLERSQAGLLAPFIEAVQSPITWQVITFTFWEAFLSTLLTLAIGLPGAYLVSHYNFKGKGLLQALTGIPFLMPTLVVAAAFNALLGPGGWINLGLIKAFGLSGPPIQFNNTLIAILVAHVFYNTTIVLRMVGDFWSHIDPRLSSAARMLGANRWQAVRRVTLPLLTPSIFFTGILALIGAFQVFDQVYVMANPGKPGEATITLVYFIYENGFRNFKMGYAAAASWILFLIVATLTLVYFRLQRRWVHYQ